MVSALVRVISVAMILALCAGATFSNQEPSELDSTARARIEQARDSMVIVTAVDQANKTVSHALGFFIRKDLVATDSEMLERNSRLQVTTATPQSIAIKVSSSGNYLLPYVLVSSPQATVAPLRLADSERVALNDSIYVLSVSGKISAGRVTAVTTIKNTRAFLLSVPIDASNKGAPVFNHYGEVIGIAAKSPDEQSAGLAWPSNVLDSMTHLGEPGGGMGAGEGPRYADQPTANVPHPSPTPTVDTRPVRLSGPMPRYTDAARAESIQGSVTLRVLVGEDGNVSAVRVIRGLPDGLNEQAIAAARLTKFKPAMKDGKPVAYWVVVEMNFNIR